MSEVNLTTEQQLLVETRLNNEKKSTAVAYLLAFFLGYFGTHNFYVGRYKLACFELGAFIFTIILIFGGGKNLLIADTGLASFVFSFLSYSMLMAFLLFDLFTLYGAVKKSTNKKRQKILDEVQGKAISKDEISTASKLINLAIIFAWIIAAVAINTRELNVARERQQDAVVNESSFSEEQYINQIVEENKTNQKLQPNKASDNANDKFYTEPEWRSENNFEKRVFSFR